jgi:hypothetical protein
MVSAIAKGKFQWQIFFSVGDLINKTTKMKKIVSLWNGNPITDNRTQ